jgi:hypothetical protein
MKIEWTDVYFGAEATIGDYNLEVRDNSYGEITWLILKDVTEIATGIAPGTDYELAKRLCEAVVATIVSVTYGV